MSEASNLAVAALLRDPVLHRQLRAYIPPASLGVSAETLAPHIKTFALAHVELAREEVWIEVARALLTEPVPAGESDG